MKKVCKVCQKKKEIEKGWVCVTCKRESKPSYWKAKADEWFSKWVRKSHSDLFNDYCSCVTCGETKRWQELP